MKFAAFVSAALASASLFAAPAAATTMLPPPPGATWAYWQFGSSSAGNLAVGASKNFAATYDSSSSLNFNVKISAWSATMTDNAISGQVYKTVTEVKAAKLTSYDAGLGVLAPEMAASGTQSDGSGANNEHTIDNHNSYDFILLQFDKKVNLAYAFATPFTLTDTVYNPNKKKNVTTSHLDSDMTVAEQNVTTPWTQKLELNATNFTAMFSDRWTSPGDSEADYFDLNNAPGTEDRYSNTWIIAADMMRTDSKYDGFKLAGFKTYHYVNPPSSPPTTAVPEPQTWAMMILGFGMVGGVARRRRRATGIAAA